MDTETPRQVRIDVSTQEVFVEDMTAEEIEAAKIGGISDFPGGPTT
jgi:hypothetical protein